MDREPVQAARVGEVLGLLWVEQRRRLGVARMKCGPRVVMDREPVQAARVGKELGLLWIEQRRRLTHK